MNKTILAALAAIVLLTGVTYYAGASEEGDLLYTYKTNVNDRFHSWFSVKYVADIESHVDEVEAELAAIELMIADGTLTPEAAVEAKTRLLEKLEVAQMAIADTRNAELTPQQIVTLTLNYERLKKSVAEYRGSLQTLDKQVAAAPEEKKRRFVSKSNKSSAQIITDTADQLGQEVADAVEILDEAYDDMTEELPEEIVEIIEAITEEETVSAEEETSNDDTADGDTSTSTPESIESAETTTSTEETTS